MPYTKSPKTWKSVADRIREGIATGEYRRGTKLPTEAEIIRNMGVSKMTVHRAFRELVAEGVVDRIERVGTFVANDVATTTKRVGLFLPATEGLLEVKILAGIRDALETNRDLVLYATDDDPVLEAELLGRAENEVDGFLILPTCHPRVSRRLERIHQKGCPVIAMDRQPQNVNLPSVTSDNYGVTRQAMHHLSSTGHRRIAFFGFLSPNENSITERYRAYADFVAEAGGDPADATRLLEIGSREIAGPELRLLQDAMLFLTSGPKPITAAFCANEHYFHALAELAQHLPRDLQKRFELATFCDWPLRPYPGLRFHQIRQDAKQLGYAAGALLEKAFSGHEIGTDRQEVPATFTVSERQLRPEVRQLNPGFRSEANWS